MIKSFTLIHESDPEKFTEKMEKIIFEYQARKLKVEIEFSTNKNEYGCIIIGRS